MSLKSAPRHNRKVPQPSTEMMGGITYSLLSANHSKLANHILLANVCLIVQIALFSKCVIVICVSGEAHDSLHFPCFFLYRCDCSCEMYKICPVGRLREHYPFLQAFTYTVLDSNPL